MMRAVLLALSLLLVATGCTTRFTAAEKAVINDGGADIMRLWVVGNETDSLLLHRRARKVSRRDVPTPAFKTLCRRMLATVNDPADEGVGIAAPQVGVSRRVVLVQRYDRKGYPFQVFINPVISACSDSVLVGPEGCLSVPGFYGRVPRSVRLRVRYRDENFRLHTETVSGYTAVIMQHEADHLNGRLYTSRAERRLVLPVEVEPKDPSHETYIR